MGAEERKVEGYRKWWGREDLQCKETAYSVPLGLAME